MWDSNNHFKSTNFLPSGAARFGYYISEIIAGVLVLFIGLIFMLILTEIGRNSLTQFALSYIEVPEDYTLKISNIKSPTIGEWRIGTLVVAYKSKPLIKIEQARIDWAPLAIVRGEFLITNLSVKTLDIFKDHLPKSANSQQKAFGKNLTNIDQKIDNLMSKIIIYTIPIEISDLSVEQVNILSANQKLEL